VGSVLRAGLPAFWVTSLAKILVGEQPCQFETWMKAHYEIEKRPRSDAGSLAKWKADHTEQLQAEIVRLKAAGWRCTIEKYFRVTGQTAILAGKPDVIVQAPNKRPKIVDVKSGRERDSDTMQVLIYMVTIPMAWQAPTMIFDGEVVYPTYRIHVEPAEAEAIRPKLFALVKQLAGTTRPDPTPSEVNCRFCDVNETDCPQRYVATETVDILTSEF
jgi:hypothetical protein